MSAFLSSLGDQKRRFEAWLCPLAALGRGSPRSLLAPVSPPFEEAAGNITFRALISLV